MQRISSKGVKFKEEIFCQKLGSVARLALIGFAVVLSMIEVAEANFNVNAGVVAATRPLIDGVTAHWGKGVVLSGVASALVGEGDLRQRAIRAGIGCGASGAVVLGLLALLAE